MLPASAEEWAEARRLRAEGMTAAAVAERLGRSKSWAHRLCRMDRPPRRSGWAGEIDPAPLRAAAERAVANGLTWSELALRAGYVHPNGYGDTSPLKRRLGMMSSIQSNRRAKARRHTTRMMRYETALRIVKALDIDPVDVGL